MIRVRALVVGIDDYKMSNWKVSGPALAACRVAEWLLGLHGIELDLHVFISPGAERDALAEAAQQSRLTLHADPSWSAIDDYVSEELPQNVAPGTCMFLYWSGHGGACAHTRHRVFMCSDYSDQTDNRCFNASNFLQLLDTQEYRNFGSHLVFADVCGTFMLGKEIVIGEHTPVNGPRIPQLVYFAAPTGTYTKSATAGGKFTETVLDVLAREGGYPDRLEDLETRLESAFAGISVARFKLAKWSEREEVEKTIGSLPGRDPASLPFYASASALCARFDIDEEAVRFAYQRTARELGLPMIPDAHSPDAVIAELCGLRDASPGNMSNGLMQFMLRLAEQPELAAKIETWFEQEAPRQRSRRKTIKQRLEAEKERKALLLLVSEQDGQIREVQSYLRRHDGWLDMGHESMKIPTRNWDEFVGAVQACLAPFVVDSALPNLEVEFAVDANLLDRPFHQIPIYPNGPSLGSQVSVILRGRRRLMSRDWAWRDRWQAYAKELECQTLDRIKWVKIDPSAPLPNDRGMCFAGFTLAPSGNAAASAARDMEVLNQLLFDGAPVLYIRHAPPPGGDWQRLSQTLTAMSPGVLPFRAFVDQFYQQRIRRVVDAEEAGLLWDDPDSNPFS